MKYVLCVLENQILSENWDIHLGALVLNGWYHKQKNEQCIC